MNRLPVSRTALALAVAALIAACGGGDAPRTAADTFADALASQTPLRSDRLRAQSVGSGGGSTAAAATVITNAQLFQGAETIFPDLFPTRTPPQQIDNLAYEGKVFQVRAYGSGNYLGIASDGRLYGLGPFTGNQLQDLGPMQGYAELVCSRINCGGGTGGGGALNGCTEGASSALRAGNRYTAVYQSNTLVAPTSTGEYTVTGVVDGAATFEGQSTVKLTSTVKGIERGGTVDATVLAFQQVADNDLTRFIGTESTFSFQGFGATNRTVFTPPTLNDEFTLAIGASLTKSTTSSSSTIVPGLPFPIPPTVGTSTTTHTYEARETVNVQGRSWSTCRYKEVTQGTAGATTFWYIVGRGIPARIEDVNAAGTVTYRAELKSATINGAPL